MDGWSLQRSSEMSDAVRVTLACTTLEAGTKRPTWRAVALGRRRSPAHWARALIRELTWQASSITTVGVSERSCPSALQGQPGSTRSSWRACALLPLI